MKKMTSVNRVDLRGSDQSISYYEQGNGPEVVLVHGTLTTAYEMVLSLFETLSPDYRLIAFDRPGQGHSTGEPSGAPQVQATAIIQAIRELGLQRPLVVGHSLGATVAVHLALDFPEEIGGVVALAPLAFPEPRLETLVFGARAMPGVQDWTAAAFSHIGLDVTLLPLLWRTMFLPQDMPAAFRDNFPFAEVSKGHAMQATGKDALQTPVSLFRSAFQYSSCNVPIIIAAGNLDIVVNPFFHAVPLSQLLGNAKIRIVGGMGHMLHHFRPDIVKIALDELSSGARGKVVEMHDRPFAA